MLLTTTSCSYQYATLSCTTHHHSTLAQTPSLVTMSHAHLVIHNATYQHPHSWPPPHPTHQTCNTSPCSHCHTSPHHSMLPMCHPTQDHSLVTLHTSSPPHTHIAHHL